MATIVIKRTSEFTNSLRDYQLFLDDKKIGTIANGQTKEFTTTSGTHKLIAKIDWASSPEISFSTEEGDRKEVVVGGFKNGKWIVPLSIAIVVLHYVLKAAFNINYLILFAVPAFLLLAFYTTFGRKKYLTLLEIN